MNSTMADTTKRPPASGQGDQRMYADLSLSAEKQAPAKGDTEAQKDGAMSTA